MARSSRFAVAGPGGVWELVVERPEPHLQMDDHVRLVMPRESVLLDAKFCEALAGVLMREAERLRGDAAFDAERRKVQ